MKTDLSLNVRAAAQDQGIKAGIDSVIAGQVGLVAMELGEAVGHYSVEKDIAEEQLLDCMENMIRENVRILDAEMFSRKHDVGMLYMSGINETRIAAGKAELAMGTQYNYMSRTKEFVAVLKEADARMTDAEQQLPRCANDTEKDVIAAKLQQATNDFCNAKLDLFGHIAEAQRKAEKEAEKAIAAAQAALPETGAKTKVSFEKKEKVAPVAKEEDFAGVPALINQVNQWLEANRSSTACASYVQHTEDFLKHIVAMAKAQGAVK